MFVKIKTAAERNEYFLESAYKEDEGFTLTLTDGESVWCGEVTDDDIDSMCKKSKMDFTTYVNQTRKAFSQEKVESIQFEFQIKRRGDGALDFTWKKHVPADDIKFQLGSVLLTMEDDPRYHIRQIFTKCIDNTSSLKEDIRSLKTDNERLSQERAMALKRLDKCITAKEEVERDLYEKFVAVLNSKKQKIRALKDGAPSPMLDESDEEEARNGVVSTSQVSEVQDVSAEIKDDTDEESQPAPSKRRRRGITVKKEADSSLVLGDDEGDGEPARVVQRPARQRQGIKKQTPSKPVLPKVSSKTSDGGGRASRGSMRKSSSHSSNRSSDNIETDDLLADLE